MENFIEFERSFIPAILIQFDYSIKFTIKNYTLILVQGRKLQWQLENHILPTYTMSLWADIFSFTGQLLGISLASSGST